MARSLAVLTLLLVPAAHARAAPIIGGTEATADQFPAIVAITVGDGLCSGALIAPDWVLTAAHCVDPKVVNEPTQAALTASVRVHVGSVDITKSAGTVVKAKTTLFNPKFDATMLGQYDVGLIELATPITNVTPYPVNLDPAKAPVGVIATLAGYGTREDNAMGGAGALYFLSNRRSITCAESQIQLSDANLLCFSNTDGKGICEGDSGSPTLATVDGVQTIVGITSFTDTACTAFSGSTRTDAEADFITTHVPDVDAVMASGGCCEAGPGGAPAMLGGIVLVGVALRPRRRRAA